MAVAAMASGGEMMAPNTKPAGQWQFHVIMCEVRDRNGRKEDQADGQKRNWAEIRAEVTPRA
jgi:hypothetical protein